MNFQLKGKARFRLWNEDGSLAEERLAENFLTEGGEALIADRLTDRDDTYGDISHMGVGTGSGQSRTSTDLASPHADGRQALDGGYPDQGTGADDNNCLFFCTIAAGTCTGSLSEAGLFNEVTAATGTMLNYYEFDPPISKGASQSLTIEMGIRVGLS